MTDIPFTYENYEAAREKLIAFINALLSEEDKVFLVSFEKGDLQWEKSFYSDFIDYPSVQWKLFNVNKLKIQNPAKHRQEVEKLVTFFATK